MKRTSLMLLCGACTAVLAGASTQSMAASLLLHSFEDGDLTQPFTATLNSQHTVNQPVMGTGNTDGDWALELVPTPTSDGDGLRLGFSINLTLEAVQALSQTRTITWDVTSLADPDPADAVTGFGTAFSYNTTLTAFETSSTFPSTFDTFFIDFVGYGGGTVSTGVTISEVLLQAMEASITGAVTGTPGFAQIFISNLYLNTDESQASPTVYIDNVRIQIPEPTAAALLGLGLAMATLRRRRGCTPGIV